MSRPSLARTVAAFLVTASRLAAKPVEKGIRLGLKRVFQHLLDHRPVVREFVLVPPVRLRLSRFARSSPRPMARYCVLPGRPRPHLLLGAARPRFVHCCPRLALQLSMVLGLLRGNRQDALEWVDALASLNEAIDLSKRDARLPPRLVRGAAARSAPGPLARAGRRTGRSYPDGDRFIFEWMEAALAKHRTPRSRGVSVRGVPSHARSRNSSPGCAGRRKQPCR